MLRYFLPALFSLPAIAEAGSESLWHFPTPISASAFVTKHHVKFAERVGRETDGRLKITVHPGGSLFKSVDILRAVRTGQVQMGSVGLFMHSAEEPIFALNNLPFLVRNPEEAVRLIKLSRPAFEEALAGKNLKLLYRALWTPHGLFSAKPLQSPEDLKGMRLRTYDHATTRIAQLAAATPTKTETSEIALAFSTHVVAGSFNSGVTGVSQKLWDYIKYYYTINYALPTSSVVVNVHAWNTLDLQTQSMVTQIAREIEEEVWSEMAVVERTLNSAMQKAGMQVLDVPPDLAVHFSKIGQQIATEWLLRAGEEGEWILQALRNP